MLVSRWHSLALIILLVVIVGRASAARSPEEIPARSNAHEAPAPSESGPTDFQLLYSDIDGYSQKSHSPERTYPTPLPVSTGLRLPHMQPGDHPQEAEPGAFGEYHSQEGAGDQVPTLSTPVVRSHFGTEGNQRSDSRFAQTRKQASLLEGRSGRLSVVEEHTRMLPGGGEMTWQRTTSPDGVTVTTVASSSGDSSSMQVLLDNLPGSSSSSLFDYVGHFSAMSAGMLNNALAPFNQLFNALDAQQQKLQGMFMSRYARAAAADAAATGSLQTAPQHSAALNAERQISAYLAAAEAEATAAAQPEQDKRMSHRRRWPCGKPQAAATPAPAQQLQLLQQQVDDQVTKYAEQFATQQEEELTRLSQEQQLHEILESNGLALTDSGTVVSLDEAQELAAAAAAADQPEVDDFYADQYVEPAEALADFADTAYDINDAAMSDAAYLIEMEDLDLALDAAAMGDYSTQVAGYLNALAESIPDVELSGFSEWVDVDFVLLILLITCTLGMFLLFLQSILQLRTVLVAGSGLAGVATFPLKVVKVVAPCPAAAVATGVKACRSSSSGSEADLRLPLLTAVEAESAVDLQQQQQHGAGVQRFYNPMHYQALADKV